VDRLQAIGAAAEHAEHWQVAQAPRCC
jgi:hypothetical protein